MRENKKRNGALPRKSKRIAGTAVLIAGALMVMFGAYSGEYVTVLKKAVWICLECIGIG